MASSSTRSANGSRIYLLTAGAALLAVLGMVAGFRATGGGISRPRMPGGAAKGPVIETAVFAVG